MISSIVRLHHSCIKAEKINPQSIWTWHVSQVRCSYWIMSKIKKRQERENFLNYSIDPVVVHCCVKRWLFCCCSDSGTFSVRIAPVPLVWQSTPCTMKLVALWQRKKIHQTPKQAQEYKIHHQQHIQWIFPFKLYRNQRKSPHWLNKCTCWDSIYAIYF